MIEQSPDGMTDRGRDGSRVTRRSLIGGVVGAGVLALGSTADDMAMALSLDDPDDQGGLDDPGRFMADAPNVRPRADWSARPPRRPATILNRAPDRIIVHHTDTANSDDGSLAHAYGLSRFIQNFHMDKRGWDDAGQQLTISRGGIVMEGRNQSLKSIQAGVLAVGAQVLHHNEHTIGIENEGSYMTKEVPDQLWASLVEVCVWLCRRYDLTPSDAIVGHRDYNKTACPGDVLYARLPELRRSVAARLDGAPKAAQEPPRPKPRPKPRPDPTPDDQDFGQLPDEPRPDPMPDIPGLPSFDDFD
ncbi:peptidoglycan recognition protein family protein [Actinomadura terrae]|uniref:peptidoglycan recognition protein family protein n=1 Tax=Actinomadura terrae TaxID=604353 RepID=UPI001FA701B6|nr:peptidoglycan recognition family protein [Actinomadura terrae]